MDKGGGGSADVDKQKGGGAGGSADGQVSSGRELALSYSLFLKVLKLAVIKREEKPLLFQLFMRDFLASLIGQKSRSL